MKEREIKYFRVITQATGFEYLVEMFTLGDQSSNWNYLYQSDSKDNVIAKISNYIVENNIDYRLINDYSTSNFDYSIVEKEIIRKRKMQQTNEQKYTLTMKISNRITNDERIIEVEGLTGPIKDLRFEFMGFKNWTKEDEESELADLYCCDECLLKNQTSIDDKEICKDLMLDEVISSQHLEIERLTEIIQDLVTTNLKLVEMLALKK